MDDRTFKAYYQHTEHFEISNPNPAWKAKRGFRWDRPDCVVRAVANATGWECSTLSIGWSTRRGGTSPR